MFYLIQSASYLSLAAFHFTGSVGDCIAIFIGIILFGLFIKENEDK